MKRDLGIAQNPLSFASLTAINCDSEALTCQFANIGEMRFLGRASLSLNCQTNK